MDKITYDKLLNSELSNLQRLAVFIGVEIVDDKRVLAQMIYRVVGYKG